MPRPRYLAAAIVLACVLAACGSSTTAASQAHDATTPAAAVMGYYDALSVHHFAVADGYLAPGLRSLLSSFSDSPANNLVTLTNLNIDVSRAVSASFLPGLPGGVSAGDYDSFAQVAVHYDATFHRVISEPNGTLTRFLYLGRLRQGARWQILTIGSGP